MPTFVLVYALHVAVGAPTALDWPEVARMASLHAPLVRLETARRAEARALRKNADTPAGGNPELALTVGPGWVNPGRVPALEFMALLTWPFDLSRSAGARQRWADSQDTQATLALADAERIAVGEALDIFASACGAQERVAVAQARVSLDTELVRIARVRRSAGAVGDGELALANVLLAGGQAALQAALGELQALLLPLAARLGLSGDTVVQLRPSPLPGPASLASLEEQLTRRPDLVRASMAPKTAEFDHSVQKRLGWSVPRVTLGAGRGPEYQGELGLTVPLPVYQRNQINAAVAGAHVATAEVETALLQRIALADLQAAYARFQSAGAAHVLLQASLPAIDDAEHLAMRGFELGQDSLASTVIARREAVQARLAVQEARLAWQRARVVLCTAAGTCMAEVGR